MRSIMLALMSGLWQFQHHDNDRIKIASKNGFIAGARWR
jgi:hypothetical protein